jgi:hypothetical protein
MLVGVIHQLSNVCSNVASLNEQSVDKSPFASYERCGDERKRRGDRGIGSDLIGPEQNRTGRKGREGKEGKERKSKRTPN